MPRQTTAFRWKETFRGWRDEGISAEAFCSAASPGYFVGVTVIEDGKLKRVPRWIAFADKKKYATKREALRDPFVVSKQQEINSPTYRALHRSNFREFAERWVKDVLINLEPSTQAGVRSHLGTAQKDPGRKPKRKLRPLAWK